MPPDRKQSGYYYPNKFARITIETMEDVMQSKSALKAILNLAGLPHLVDNYPPDNLEKEFDFADYTALSVALEEMYGPRGGRGLALRVGRAMFAKGLRAFGALAGVTDLSFQVLPLSAKLKVGVPALANILTQFGDQISNVYEEGDDRIIFTIERCPMCYDRKSDNRAVCYIEQGLLQEGLRWLSDGHEFRVDIESCIAKGDDMGKYVIYKDPIS
jgi:predicted hydrocarbon binding protein